MSQQTAHKPKPEPEPEPKTIEATITFPISPAGPLHAEFPARETVGVLREQAMIHFGVAADTQHSYYLTHDGKKIENSETISEVAGNAHAVKFTLVKDTVQG